MKKNAKIVFIITSIVLLGVLFAIIDYFRAKADKKPIFAINTTTNAAIYKVGDTNDYWGLGYKVVSCNNLGGKVSYHFGFYNMERVCSNIPNNYFTVVDETEACDPALELIYEDGNYKYYFPCIKSETVFIVFEDSSRIPVKNALTESSTNWGKLITEKYPEMFIKEEKYKLDTVTLKVNESAKVMLGKKQYTLKLKETRRIPLCDELSPSNSVYPMPTPCALDEKSSYDVSILINDAEFALDSGYNPSQQMITTTYRTNYVVYYVPSYNEKEATFFIEEDILWEKETRLIIGNYLVYIDKNNKVIDIKSFSREVQIWGKQYSGISLNEITKMINDGKDLRKKNT